MFELRACTALGHLWAGGGEKARAKALLQRIYSAFSDAESRSGACAHVLAAMGLIIEYSLYLPLVNRHLPFEETPMPVPGKCKLV